jgi:hypothetical protein
MPHAEIWLTIGLAFDKSSVSDEKLTTRIKQFIIEIAEILSHTNILQ